MLDNKRGSVVSRLCLFFLPARQTALKSAMTGRAKNVMDQVPQKSHPRQGHWGGSGEGQGMMDNCEFFFFFSLLGVRQHSSQCQRPRLQRNRVPEDVCIHVSMNPQKERSKNEKMECHLSDSSEYYTGILGIFLPLSNTVTLTHTHTQICP